MKPPFLLSIYTSSPCSWTRCNPILRLALDRPILGIRLVAKERWYPALFPSKSSTVKQIAKHIVRRLENDWKEDDPSKRIVPCLPWNFCTQALTCGRCDISKQGACKSSGMSTCWPVLHMPVHGTSSIRLLRLLPPDPSVHKVYLFRPTVKSSCCAILWNLRRAMPAFPHYHVDSAYSIRQLRSKVKGMRWLDQL